MAEAENPYTELLRERGVPEEYHPYFAEHGIGGLAERMGIVFETMGPELTTGRFPVEGNTQPTGLVHGGAHVALAETLGSTAANLHGGGEKVAVGVDINATHQKGTSTGWVHGSARALHLGRSLCIHEVVMTDDQGRRLSTARITNMLIDRQKS